jgi:hypothetical protein
MSEQDQDRVIYHAETKTVKEAEEAVARHSQEIVAAGGTMGVGYGRQKSGGGIVMITLPASLEVDPANLLPGSGLRFSKVRAQVIRKPKEQKNA